MQRFDDFYERFALNRQQSCLLQVFFNSIKSITYFMFDESELAREWPGQTINLYRLKDRFSTKVAPAKPCFKSIRTPE
ncbi:hypothetical protein [Pseudomonas sp. 3A(2025)]